MAYADDGVRAKLSALNETQDSIVSVAQWVMFHRRHADRTAELWLERLKESNTSKKLNLIYLANEVVQQSKARKKEDFLLAFSPIIADAAATAYKGSTQEVQLKIRRVVEVWRQRGIFETAIQDAVEKRIDDIDKSRSSARPAGARLGGSLFGSTSSVPSELQPLVQPQNNIARAESAMRPLLSTASTEYTKMTDPAFPVPTPPVHAARLSTLLKNLASAEGAVNDSIKARQELITALEKLLDDNTTKLAEDQNTATELSTRRCTTESKKKEVEDGIMRGLSAGTFNAPLPGQSNGSEGNNSADTSPEMEAFTPPPPDVETFAPTASPRPEPSYPADDRAYGQDFPEQDSYMPDPVQEQHPSYNEPPPAFEPPPAMQANAATPDVEALLKTLAAPPHPVRTSSAQSADAPADPRLKRRKTSHKPSDMDDDIFGGNEGVGIDSDVAAMLGAQ
ncbi:hypothetical protein AAFC00_000113 [Neodothiora populina]|uniref:CID domain-containing protein n=1 Tax=Neodothiora populina TaxID=2781224 RepID=A0ABR3P1Z6_9PEZI